MENEEVLFTTQMKYTYEEYVKCSNRVCRTANFLSYALWLGAGIFLAGLALSGRGYGKAFLILAACVARVLRGPAVKREKQRKEFDEPGSLADQTLTYRFYRTCFQCLEGAAEFGNEPDLIPYYDLTKIIETKTNFYLMYARRKGFIIVKENCSPSLIYFIRNLKNEPKSPFYNEKKEAQISYSKTSQEIIRRVGCPCEVLPADMPEEEIMRQYALAREEAGEKGYPVLVAVNGTLLESLEISEEDGYEKEELLRADREDGKDLLNEWYREFVEESGEEPAFFTEWRGRLEQGPALDSFLSLSSFADQYEEFILFRVPVDEPWKVLAYVPIGGWNGCPGTDDMMAVSRYWYEKYRAVPAVIGFDTLEYIVEHPVRSEMDAWKLAEEQFAFCEDAVFQCTDTGMLGELADSLMKSTVWYFWWD